MAKKERKPLTTNGQITAEAQAIVKEVQKILTENQLCQGEYTLHVGTSVVRKKCHVVVYNNRTGNPVGDALVDISWLDIFDDNHGYWSKAAKVIIESLGFNDCRKIENVRNYEFTF